MSDLLPFCSVKQSHHITNRLWVQLHFSTDSVTQVPIINRKWVTLLYMFPFSHEYYHAQIVRYHPVPLLLLLLQMPGFSRWEVGVHVVLEAILTLMLDCMSITEPERQMFYYLFRQSGLLHLFREWQLRHGRRHEIEAWSEDIYRPGPVSVTFLSMIVNWQCYDKSNYRPVSVSCLSVIVNWQLWQAHAKWAQKKESFWLRKVFQNCQCCLCFCDFH